MTQPTAIRPACVAGGFYPDDPQRLLARLDALLAAARSSEDASGALAIVSPHAGYRYSGPVAASAFGQLMSRRAAVRRVVVLGPAHFTRLRGMALPRWDAFETRLGAIRIDESARTLAAPCPVLSAPTRPITVSTPSKSSYRSCSGCSAPRSRSSRSSSGRSTRTGPLT
jgi:AmmeMemoRadiSam system protein B